METTWRDSLRSQLDAAIETLDNAIVACPQELWSDRSRYPEFWYLVYHTLFFLDYYLSESSEGFAPPPPFTLAELDPAGVLPDRVYSQEELRAYLVHGRAKASALLTSLGEEQAHRRSGFARPVTSVAELLLQTLRHVQHHAAQLNLILRQVTDSAPGWVVRGRGAPEMPTAGQDAPAADASGRRDEPARYEEPGPPAAGACQKVTLAEKLALFHEHWSPKVVAELNGQQVKLTKLQGEFVWHHHENEDELFLVLSGRLRMELRDRHELLGPGDMIVIPRGVEHRPCAEDEVAVMLFEPASTLNTGNVVGERTVERLERL